MTICTSRQWTVAAVAIIGIALGAANPAAAQDAADSVVVAQTSDTLTLDPSRDTSPISLNIFKNVFDQLTDIRADGSVGPLLAESWQANEDATVWTFTIQDDVRFHDGSPVTVGDVVWTYEKIMADDASPVNAYLRAVESVEAVGDDQVRFTLNAPFAPFDRQVSLVSIMPQAAYEALGRDFSTSPIGSGAYRVVEWVKDDRVELVANEDYHGGVPAIRHLVFRPVPSEASRTSALLSGELDIVPLLPPAFLPTLERRDDIRVETVASNRILYVGFNAQQAPLDNVLVRRAIDHAIDRSAITDQLLRGLGEPAGQVVAPVTFGYDASIVPTSYDPDLSRQLLAEAGYDGEPILFQFPNNRYAFGVEVAQAVAGYMTEVGLNVEMQSMEYAAFFPLWVNRQLTGMHLFGFGPSIMDAELPLRSLFETGPSRGYWSDPQVDALIAQQRAESDLDERAAIIAQIWQHVREAVPYSMLYNEVQAYGIAEGVDWTPRPDERLLFYTGAAD